MDKDHVLPPFGRISSFSIGGNQENVNLDLAENRVKADSGHFSHDISGMPDSPPKYMGHRRAHSEIFTLPDDISFDSDLGVVGGFDGPSYTDETEEDLFSMYLDVDKLNSSSAKPGPPCSVEMQTTKMAATTMPENYGYGSGDRPRTKHLHSMSMDSSTTFKPEETSSIADKKSMSATKLAELALVDPKRAKRIWANRQSAARSKERKMRYIAELERKVQTLQTETTALSAQLTLLQRDTHGLTAENNELKLRIQAMEQQFHLQDAVSDALRKEIQHLRVITGQNLANGGPMMNFPPPYRPNQQFHPNNQAMQTMLTAQQFQQLQFQSRNQQQQHFFQPPQLHQYQQQQQQLHQFQQQQQLHQFHQQQQRHQNLG
uniref:probable transcription factor PosF21 n=1 Tax=Erigeron canadensis TaxID=72917 RepID=UPI001CB8B9BE|nr:probable transcription factor PosF21 [Erigeron canadensis]